MHPSIWVSGDLNHQLHTERAAWEIWKREIPRLPSNKRNPKWPQKPIASSHTRACSCPLGWLAHCPSGWSKGLYSEHRGSQHGVFSQADSGEQELDEAAICLGQHQPHCNHCFWSYSHTLAQVQLGQWVSFRALTLHWLIFGQNPN